MTRAVESNPSADDTACGDTSRCPLCGEPNNCQLCTTAAYKGPCWCATAQIPDELTSRVPAAACHRACICQSCVTQYQRDHAGAFPVVPGDFYFDANGLMVFTAAYHGRRGCCCGNDCRHCPYPRPPA